MTSMVERCTSAARARSSAKAAAVSTSADCCALVEFLDVWVWNDWDNVRTTQNHYAYTISLVSKLLCATACWSSNARRRWCSGSICQEALPCSCWASCLRWQKQKSCSLSEGNQEAIVIKKKSFSDWRFWTSKWNLFSWWTANSWTVGWKFQISHTTVAPETHNLPFCTSKSVHELISCGLWGETYGKKKVLQKGVLRLLCLRGFVCHLPIL